MIRTTKAPSAITEKEKYKRLAKLSATQRSIYCTIINRSKQGEWTRYRHFEDIDSPVQRVSEMMHLTALKINKRKVKDVGAGGGLELFNEYCV